MVQIGAVGGGPPDEPSEGLSSDEPRDRRPPRRDDNRRYEPEHPPNRGPPGARPLDLQEETLEEDHLDEMDKMVEEVGMDLQEEMEKMVNLDKMEEDDMVTLYLDILCQLKQQLH